MKHFRLVPLKIAVAEEAIEADVAFDALLEGDGLPRSICPVGGFYRVDEAPGMRLHLVVSDELRTRGDVRAKVTFPLFDESRLRCGALSERRRLAQN